MRLHLPHQESMLSPVFLLVCSVAIFTVQNSRDLEVFEMGQTPNSGLGPRISHLQNIQSGRDLSEVHDSHRTLSSREPGVGPDLTSLHRWNYNQENKTFL